MFLEDWHFAWIELFILIFLLKGVWKVIFVFNSCATIRSTLLLMAPKQSKHEKKGDGYGASSSILFVWMLRRFQMRRLQSYSNRWSCCPWKSWRWLRRRLALTRRRWRSRSKWRMNGQSSSKPKSQSCKSQWKMRSMQRRPRYAMRTTRLRPTVSVRLCWTLLLSPTVETATTSLFVPRMALVAFVKPLWKPWVSRKTPKYNLSCRGINLSAFDPTKTLRKVGIRDGDEITATDINTPSVAADAPTIALTPPSTEAAVDIDDVIEDSDSDDEDAMEDDYWADVVSYPRHPEVIPVWWEWLSADGRVCIWWASDASSHQRRWWARECLRWHSQTIPTPIPYPDIKIKKVVLLTCVHLTHPTAVSEWRFLRLDKVDGILPTRLFGNGGSGFCNFRPSTEDENSAAAQLLFVFIEVSQKHLHTILFNASSIEREFL